jgi:transcriptional regulator with XRE-family HTH domain
MATTAAEVDAHVGQRMRQRRESLGMSQGRLGRHLGLTFSQVQKYEKGTNRIGAGRLFLLANFLGVPVHYFFEGLAETDALPNRRTDANGELAALDDAFLAIPDLETRQSVLALVSSLAQTRAVGRPRRRAAGKV